MASAGHRRSSTGIWLEGSGRLFLPSPLKSSFGESQRKHCTRYNTAHQLSMPEGEESTQARRSAD